ncbi:MAG TPA: hypothetical protein VMU38_06325 [Candidatus Binatia bacterium]|nr:hypothetical protein [Candidatus Binatia bacterium]
MYVQPLESSLTPNSLASPAGNAESEGALVRGSTAAAAGDGISRFAPPASNDSGSLQGLFGPLMGVLQQLMQVLQSLMGYGCGNGSGSANERFFQNASGSSDGDPHLSFNGQKWNNMSSQPDLLDSDSFAGGFRLSTQVTQPNGKGVTWNQSATVALNNGATTVTMNNDGAASITSYGRQISIARGQTVQLGDGASATLDQNGSLVVTAQNGSGGRIEATLNPQGKGVNVDVTAHDVDLGGALVNGPPSSSGPIGGGPISGGPIIGPYPIGQPPIIEPPPVGWPQPASE